MALARAPKFIGSILLILALIGAAVFYITTPLREYAAQEEALPVLSTVPEFSLIDQDSKPIGLSDLKGRIWLADVIFTRCEGICPVMSGNFSKLQPALAGSDVRLVSFSVDPEHDSEAVLREYAKRFNADPTRWTFVTGDRPTIFELSKKGFLLGVDSAGLSPNELVTHSEKFVLIDKKGQMRAYYDGTDSTTQKQILADIDALRNE